MVSRVKFWLIAGYLLGLSSPGFASPRILTAPNGERYAAGQVCVKLSPFVRGILVSREMVNGDLTSPRFGIPSLDAFCERVEVAHIHRWEPNPRPHRELVNRGMDLYFTLFVPEDRDIFLVARDLVKDPAVVEAFPNFLLPLDEVTNDPMVPQQWGLSKISAFAGFDVTHGDSSGVVLGGALDSGTDWQHPDLVRSLWINTPEDINGNGRFDNFPSGQGGDLDNVDNDSDGYTDDVIGWDMTGYDPDPTPMNGSIHGTHVWGIMLATSNNSLGVASSGYRTKGFAFRCGDDTGIWLSDAIEGINFMINHNGWVFNMSFGGTSEYAPLTSAIASAHAAGLVAVAAAGNTSLEERHYPGATQYVVGVMSSNQADLKSSFSTYGTFYDVCAPGEAILSTLPDSSYGNLQGTSMASPMTAGVVEIIKGMHPSWTNTQVENELYANCDSMPDTLFLQGKLGHGRISLIRAVGRAVRCDLFYVSRRINDSSGNNNGIADAGETVGLVVRLRNDWGWQTATSVQATLTTTDTTVTITKSQATFPNIPSPGSAECSTDSFTVYVHTTALPHQVTFNISYRSTPPTIDTLGSFTLPVVKPRILLVKDDIGSNYDGWFITPLNLLNALYDTFNVLRQGSPPSGLLTQYPVVFWWTGNDSTTTLVPADTAALKAFLDAGNKLFLTGQNVGQDVASRYPTFYSNYLHANFVQASSGNIFLTGVDGDPVGKRSGDTLALAGGGGAQNARSNDVITPVGGAQAAFNYRGSSNVAGITFSGTYKLAYFGFPAEAIDGSAPRYVQRDEIIRRILVWFGGTLGVEESSQEVFRFQPTAQAFTLGAFAPNPLSGEGGLEFGLPVATRMDLGIYNVAGQRIRTLVSGERAAGRYWARWNGKDESGKPVASGVYLCRLQTGGFAQTRSVVVLR